jgi:hypothetical protein
LPELREWEDKRDKRLMQLFSVPITLRLIHPQAARLSLPARRFEGSCGTGSAGPCQDEPAPVTL